MLITATLALFACQQDSLTYPEGGNVPRSLSFAEVQWLRHNDLLRPAAATAAPEGPISCLPEYAPMSGMLIAYEGSSSQKTVLAKMAAAATNYGDAIVYCVVDTTSEISTATSKLQSEGADMSKVEFPVKTTDSIWIRDYGPRYIYQNGVRAIVDHDYNRPRNNDNAFSIFFGNYLQQCRYDHDMTHGGGNFHLDALGEGYLTRLINNENSNLSETQIRNKFIDYQNLNLTLFDPFPTSVDSTQHLDMWMIVVDDNTVIISEWPTQSSSTQAQICDSAAVTMTAKGFNVIRMPALRTSGWSGVHYTYANAVIMNDCVMVPQFSNSAVSSYNAQALSIWQAACPGKTIVPINADAVVSSAGVLHCIMMHVPSASNGVLPTSYLRAPNSGSYAIGDSIDITWSSDDDVEVVSVDLDYSIDGGNSWISIASGLSQKGARVFSAPSTPSSLGQIRVTAFDALGNSTSDTNDDYLSFAGGSNSAALISYGSGKAGSNGVPLLGANANPVLGNPIQLQISNALANATVYLLFGAAPANLTYDGGELLVNHSKVYNLTSDTNGYSSLSGTVPSRAALVGKSYYWQAWIANDPAASGNGWASTNGLQTLLGY
jgi:agmatine/peptidylarginine deiminase